MDTTTTARHQQATPAGLAALFHREYAGMVRLATLMVGREAVAEELVQDAFVKVAGRWDTIDGDAGGYLTRTVVNGCRSWHRRRAVERRLPLPRAEHAHQPERDDELLQALGRLSHRRRAAVVLRYYEGCDDAEIADLLGCARPTVRSLVHRGLTQLREVLDHA